tara:strand:- start:102 stop:1046 length:945 start_codon:yes stop_codon:yes gene_type:complete
MRDILKIFLRPLLFLKISFFIIRPKILAFLSFRKFLVQENINNIKRKFTTRITQIDGNLLHLYDDDYSQIMLDKNNPNELKHLHYGNATNDEINKMIIKSVLKPGDTCIDVGAYIGSYTLFMANLVGPTGEVFSFEPNKETITILNNNIALNGYENVRLYNHAVGELSGNEKFYKIDKSSGATANSSLVRNEKISGDLKDFVIEENVNVITLDDLVENQKIKLIKIDVEGYELNVLRGAKEIISTYRPIIIMEFISNRLEFLQINQIDFKSLLSDYYNAYEISISVKAGRASLEPFDFERKVNSGDIVLIPKLQ